MTEVHDRYEPYDYEPTEFDFDAADAYEDSIRDSLAAIPVDAAKRYLMRFGDAIDERVQDCLRQADQLRAGFPGARLTLSITSVEIMIRFLLLHPLTQGAFLSEQWAEVLLERIIRTGRTSGDRALLPAVLRNWQVEIGDFRLSAGKSLWAFLTETAWPARDRSVHALDPIAAALADEGFEAARTFREQVIGRIATTLGFTLERTGHWCKIQQESGAFEEVMPETPFKRR